VTDTVDLPPVRFAALVAPAVDRVFVTGIRAALDGGRELVDRYGGARAVGYLVDLRNPLAAGRTVTRDGLAGVYRYSDPAAVDRTVQGSVDHGLLARTPDGGLAATERGREFLRELSALLARALAERWQGHDGTVERLNRSLARVLADAAATAGAAWAVQAPPHEPAGTPPPVLLLNRLSTLRYHRADAHAAAWREAGLTAAEMVAMSRGSPWTPQRQAVEDETNRRAAPPFAVLTPKERLTMLADLAALP
jgi:hypothetical protein